MKKRFVLILCIAMIMGLAACDSNSGNTDANDGDGHWPSGNLTLSVPWKAGGGADTSVRLIAKYWELELDTNIVIENREGADGLVGTTYYYGLKQDCTNILFMAQPFYANNIIASNASFGMDDIAILNCIELDPSCLAVMPGADYQSIEALDAAIKANPGQIRFGVNGGSPHLIMANMLIDEFGWDVKMVYYGGAAESRTALLGGHVDVIATTLTGCVDEVPIVVGAYESNPGWPDVPTYGSISSNNDVPLFATARFVAVSAEAKAAYPERYQILVDSLQRTFARDDFQAALRDAGRDAVSNWYGPTESETMNRSLYDFTETYQDLLSGS